MAAPASGCSPHSSSSVKSLPPPCPKSPPDYPDLYGKRRELAKVQMLEREINFLEEELKFVQSLHPASQCCKEVSDFVVGNPDPLIPTNRKNRRSCRFWKWLCGIPCFNFSWICCCCCSGFSCCCPKLPRCYVSNPCPRTSSCCSSRCCDGCCNCRSCLPPPPNNWPCCCFSSAAASCGCRFPSFNCCICGNCRKISSGGGGGSSEKNNSCCCPDLSSCCCAFKFPSFSCCSKNGCGGGGGEKNNSCCTWKWKWCCCPKVRRPRCCKCTKNQCNCCSNPCCCCPSF